MACQLAIDNPKTLSGFDWLNTRYVSNWPFGPSYVVAYDSARNLVFLGPGGGFYILNVANPQNLKVSEEIQKLLSGINPAATSLQTTR